MGQPRVDLLLRRKPEIFLVVSGSSLTHISQVEAAWNDTLTKNNLTKSPEKTRHESSSVDGENQLSARL